MNRLIAVASIALFACGGTPSPDKRPQPPTVASFSASPASIAAGASSTLSWTTTGAATLFIDHGVGTVTGTSVSVTPTATTTYTLTATNAAGSTTASTAVTVTPAATKPTISSFDANPASIAAGASSTLSWSVTGATAISIDQGVGTVTGTSKAVSPTATTTYTLTASNAAGSATATTSVTVTQGLQVSSFTATPNPAVSGAAVTLAWSTTGATSLSIDNGGGAFAPSTTSTIVHPTSSTTYMLTATGGGKSVSTAITVTVDPAAPKPLISSFTADAPYVLSGGSGTTLRWRVENAATVTIDQGVGSVTTGSAPVTPASSTTYTLTATNSSGSSTATTRVTVGPAASAFLTPGTPAGSPTVTFTLDARQSVHPISPLIYGYNASSPSSAPPGATLLRLGGNRWTAYNWETNASNAGSDYLYESDSYLTSSNTPGEAVRPTVAADATAGVSTLITLPMQGWVAADEAGPVTGGPPFTAPQSIRFFQTLPRKGSALSSSSPDLTDRFVYQDEFVARLQTQFPAQFNGGGPPALFELDNEPDLWSSTHAEIQYVPLTYDAYLRKTYDLASSVKDLAPNTAVFGPASYGFGGYVNFQGAPDADANAFNPAGNGSGAGGTGIWFLDRYMQKVHTESAAQGRRLVDVLDLHWYSEARGPDGTGALQRVADTCATCNDPGVQAARVQAPRSLWDASYSCLSDGTAPVSCEHSWIANYFASWTTGAYGPIQLLNWLGQKIAYDWPGTKLAFTEYSYGGANDISGGVAEADALGIFGAQGVYAATYWPLGGDNRFVQAAFRNFTDFDNANGKFGDMSFAASSSDLGKAAVYASFDSANPSGRVVVVAINRTTAALSTQLQLTYPWSFTKAHAYQLTAASTYTAPSVIPTPLADLTVTLNAFAVSLPAMSVTTYVLAP